VSPLILQYLKANAISRPAAWHLSVPDLIKNLLGFIFRNFPSGSINPPESMDEGEN
jgi:hypothetical protein